MWAAVLIPMWLRNHDTATENRSAERFGQAMRVLSRKEQDENDQMNDADDDQRHQRDAEPVAPATPESRSVPTPTRSHRPTVARRPQPRQRPQRSMAQRRARTLGVLAGLLLVLTIAAVATPVPWWAPLPVAALVVAFVVHLRVQALQQQRRRSSTRRGSVGRPRRGQTDGPEQRIATSASSFSSGSSKALVVETKGTRSDVDVTFDESADDPETWRPNPLPLPTYVTAPKAVRPIKVIDLTTPGAWTSGRFLEDDLADEDLLAAEIAGDELDALLEQEVAPQAESHEADENKRRAVGD
jgi:hypothetical protein